MGNVVVNTIMRMFTRKAGGKAMKSAKKSMGAKRANRTVATKSVPRRGAPKVRRSSTKGTYGSRKGDKSETG